jgi:two-component system cell cycle sensor histidine kinase/response regulator CckA
MEKAYAAVSESAPRGPMQTQSWQAQARPPFDPLLIAMAAGFIVVVGALAYPAFRTNPFSAPGLMLIFTAVAVALIGLFAFGRSEARSPDGDVWVEMLDALGEPAALVLTSGQVLAFNGAWAEENGAMVALPKGRSVSALYMAFAQAREGEPARAIVTIGAREIEVMISRAGEGRYLVRAAPEAVLGLAHTPAMAVGTGASAEEGRAMAAGAPFGSAVIAHDDIFSGRVEEPNAALALLTGPASARDAAFGHLFEPNGVIEARNKLTAGSSGPIELVARAHPDRMLHLYVAPEGDTRLAVRRLGPEVDGAATQPGPEDAGRRPAGRGRGPRLQQSADRHPAAAVGPAGAASGGRPVL